MSVSGAHEQELTNQVTRAWSRCLARADAEPANGLTVRLNSDASAPASLLSTLSTEITLLAIEAHRAHSVMLHAAALADPATGRAVLLVGPSGMGKTTAARTLGADLGYLTDEMVAIGPDLDVKAYPKPLSILTGDSPTKDQVSPDDLGLGPTPDSSQVAGVLLLAREPCAETQVEGLSISQALAALAPHTSYLASLARPLHRLAEIVDAAGGVSVAHYDDAASLRPIIDSLFGRS